ncbi:hypothetical protein KKA47_07070, partial [bacterium]|nr:hypothetical protein [bacterium]
MGIYLGIDIGVISIKIAGFTKKPNDLIKKKLDSLDGIVWVNESLFYLPAKRTAGTPFIMVDEMISKIITLVGESNIEGISASGTGAGLLRKKYNIDLENEFTAIATAMSRLYPEVETIFEMGGESSKFIALDKGKDGLVGIADYGINGDCAAGTGSFIDQQASRLHYNVEDIGNVASTAQKTARIAGRCSVFAKSDMIHAQQKGFTPAEILKGLCIAVARNYKATIVKGKTFKKPVAFIGGLSLNSGVADAIRESFGFDNTELLIPKESAFMGALGTSLLSYTKNFSDNIYIHSAESIETKKEESTLDPLSKENVIFLRDKVQFRELDNDKKTDTYLGIDVGSVSTNLVVIDLDGNVIKSIYTMTKSRPIEVVSEGLKEIESEIGDKINILGVGTTGSGRELIGELIGADTITDEITCHKTGASHVAKTLTDGTVDTIFEIGGQDSKFIRMNDGIVTDFTMNEACAAGTGSFLEEQAEKLGINIKDEFASLALNSSSPINMGERCTVFMERDVNAYQARGANVEDIAAGLSYSVVYNYLNRVVRGRDIGNNIYFQGGTAYNDAVACAFAKILNKTIIVPPHNGVIGAIGAALITRRLSFVVRENLQRTKDEIRTTKFRGFDLSQVEYKIREFTCPACSNNCDIQEFTVNSEKTYWGDKCSEKYRKKSKGFQKPSIDNIIKRRDEFLYEGYDPKKRVAGPTVGIPRCMYFYDRFPFWKAYFEKLGCNVAISPESNKKIIQDGLSSTVAEPCYPIKIAHGHIKHLLGENNVDYVWVPNVLNAEPSVNDHRIPYLCPWGMTLPFVIKAAPAFQEDLSKILAPTIQFFYGKKYLAKCLKATAKQLGASDSLNKKAIDAAYLAWHKFNVSLKVLGKRTLKEIEGNNESAIILIGRPYNLYDMGINLSIPTKLRETYGINVIPFEYLPTDDIEIKDVAENMFWNYGRKILAAVKYTA